MLTHLLAGLADQARTPFQQNVSRCTRLLKEKRTESKRKLTYLSAARGFCSCFNGFSLIRFSIINTVRIE